MQVAHLPESSSDIERRKELYTFAIRGYKELVQTVCAHLHFSVLWTSGWVADCSSVGTWAASAAHVQLSNT